MGFLFQSVCCAVAVVVLWLGSAHAQQSATTVEAYLKKEASFEILSQTAPNEALVVAEELIAMAKKLGVDTLLLEAYQNRAVTLSALGIFDAAHTDLLEGYRLATRIRHANYQVRFAQLLAQGFQSMGDFDKSTEYLLAAKKVNKSTGQGDTLQIEMELGFNLAAQGQIEEGLRILHHCLDVAIATGEREAAYRALDNLGNVYFESGEPAKALTYLLRENEFPEQIASNYHRAVYFEHLAEVYVELKDWPNAHHVLDSACHYAQLIASNDWLFECHKLRTEVEAAKGNYQAALAHHKRYLELKDSVYQESYANTFAAMTTLHEVEAKESAITSLQMEKSLQDERLRKVALQRNGLIALAVLVVVIAYLLFRAVQQRRESRMKAQFSGDLIQEQENERQRISRELHDNIGQYLLFIRNKVAHNTAENSNHALLETVDAALTEVRAISKELYPNQLERYGLEASIELLFDNLRQGSELFATCELAEVEAHLSKEQQLGVFRIVQESLNNTMKYAEATAFRVEGQVVNKRVEFVVQDNGKGAHQTVVATNKHRSFGLLNIEERIRLLGGRHHFVTAPGKGFKLTFTLPL
jgi:signal transduction histidine kinase